MRGKAARTLQLLSKVLCARCSKAVLSALLRGAIGCLCLSLNSTDVSNSTGGGSLCASLSCIGGKGGVGLAFAIGGCLWHFRHGRVGGICLVRAAGGRGACGIRRVWLRRRCGAGSGARAGCRIGSVGRVGARPLQQVWTSKLESSACRAGVGGSVCAAVVLNQRALRWRSSHDW